MLKLAPARGDSPKPAALSIWPARFFADDRFWNGLLNWATVEQPRLAAEQQHVQIKPRILAHPEGARVLSEFERLSDRRQAS